MTLIPRVAACSIVRGVHSAKLTQSFPPIGLSPEDRDTKAIASPKKFIVAEKILLLYKQENSGKIFIYQIYIYSIIQFKYIFYNYLFAALFQRIYTNLRF